MKAQVERVSRDQLRQLMYDLEFTTEERSAFDGLLDYGTALWVGYINNQLVCFWGLLPMSLLSDRAFLWLHTRPEIRGNEFTFIRTSQIVVKEMLKEYKTITGYTFANQPQSIRWLRLLGARFEPFREGILFFTIGGNNG